MYPRRHSGTHGSFSRFSSHLRGVSRSSHREAPRVPGVVGKTHAAARVKRTPGPRTKADRATIDRNNKESASSLKRKSSQEGNTKNPPRMQGNSPIRHAQSHRESTRARWISLRNPETRSSICHFLHPDKGEGITSQALHHR